MYNLLSAYNRATSAYNRGVWFHGSQRADITAFSCGSVVEGASPKGARGHVGTYLTRDRKYASFYAKGGGCIYTLQIDVKYPLLIERTDFASALFDPDRNEVDRLCRQALADGHDFIDIPYIMEAVVLDPICITILKAEPAMKTPRK